MGDPALDTFSKRPPLIGPTSNRKLPAAVSMSLPADGTRPADMAETTTMVGVAASPRARATIATARAIGRTQPAVEIQPMETDAIRIDELSLRLPNGVPLVTATGLSIGDAVAAGRVCLIESARDIGRFVGGSVLVTATTDPDWVPIMKRAAAIVTNRGGRTSHAAIVSRELGLPAVVGTGDGDRPGYGIADLDPTAECPADHFKQFAGLVRGFAQRRHLEIDAVFRFRIHKIYSRQ